VCKPKQILYPSTNADVVNIVLNSSKIRIVGGGASFSPLVCTEDVLISLKNMKRVLTQTNTSITYEAGASLEEVLSHLLKTNKIIHGFGSIQVQSLAGAFSTSHHGLTFNSFAEEVTGLTAVLANGSVINVTDLFFWRSHLGMLGIITSMTINIYPNTHVDISEKKISLDAALTSLLTADAGIIETNYGQRDSAMLRHIVYSSGTKKEKYPVATNHFIAAVWDSFVLPTMVLLPAFATLPLLEFFHDMERTGIPIVEAWSHNPEYGMMYSAYAIPYENCTKFINSITPKYHIITTLLVRYVHGQENTTCLSFATKKSCVVDVYDMLSQTHLVDFHKKLEQNVSYYGGTSHWGKWYVGDTKYQVKNIPCYERFKTERARLDPDGKFLNEYTREIIDLNYSGYDKRYNKNSHNADPYRVLLWGILLVFVSIPVMFVTDDDSKRHPRNFKKV